VRPDFTNKDQLISPREPFFSSAHGWLAPARIHTYSTITAIHELNSVCFKKCITGRMAAGSLERNEDTCMKNCVDRYMDANMTVIRHLEKMRM
jgi:hypothetical protein